MKEEGVGEELSVDVDFLGGRGEGGVRCVLLTPENLENLDGEYKAFGLHFRHFQPPNPPHGSATEMFS